MNAPAAGGRRPRADFARNRAGILDSAERHFAAEGVGASLETVAKGAGVGSATLYRHFPTREALLAEVLDRRVEQIESERARIEHMDDTGEALAAWLVALEEFFAAFDGLPEPLRDAMRHEHNPLTTTCTGFVDRTEYFLAAAQRDGRADPSVRGRDLFLAALMLSWSRAAFLADQHSAQQLSILISRGWIPRD